ncbi:MAG: choice-of-anchor D domain-containing protein [Candidatus Paceibacterota bacterium]|jgi:hypothetical protein
MRGLNFKKFILLSVVLVVSALFLISSHKARAAETGQVWGSCESGTLYCDNFSNRDPGYKFSPIVNGRITKLCAYIKGTVHVGLYDSSSYYLGDQYGVTITSSSYKWTCVSLSTPLNVSAAEVYFVLVDNMNTGSFGCYRENPGIPKTCNNVQILRGVNARTSLGFDSDHYEFTSGISGMPDIVFEIVAPPQISVTPSPSFYFGSINVGSNGDYAFTVKNTGTGTLTGSVSGLSTPFSCFSGCSYGLTAGQQQSTTLRFTPGSVGAFSGTAIFNSNASNISIALTGDGAVANCIPDYTTGNYTVNNTALGGTNTCVIKTGTIVGAEGGNLTVGSGINIQMNPSSLWLFNAGKSIFVDGVISKAYRTAIIRKGNLTGPTVSVVLSATPSSGTAPLNGVDLTATVSGTATGNIGYQFDCTNNGSWEASTTISNTSYTATDLCNYSSVGTYTAKARVTRSGVTAENTTTITVSSGCFCSSGACCTNGCNYDSLGTVCRASAGDCDLAETCSGSGATCPSDAFRPSSYICNTWTEYDYRCTGAACDNDAQSQNRTVTQKCSGSASCNGAITNGNWSSWTNIGSGCASTEKCTTDNSTYASCNYDASCDCACNDGTCSSTCGETCSTCPDDCGVCNPADVIQDCASFGITTGNPSFGPGLTASKGDLLVQNEDGFSYRNYWCRVGTICYVDEAPDPYEYIEVWTSSEGSAMCRSNVMGVASTCGGVDDTCNASNSYLNTECMYCIVKQ